MKFLIKHLSNDINLQDDEDSRNFEQDTLSIGRSIDNDLIIEGINCAPKHCIISRDKAKKLHIKSISSSGILINGSVKQEAVIKSGDIIKVANVYLHINQLDSGYDLILEVIDENQANAGIEKLKLKRNVFQRLRPGSTFKLRRLSWVAVCLSLVLFFLMPLVSIYVPSLNNALKNSHFPLLRATSVNSWSIGPVSRYHIKIADKCDACHSEEAFDPIPDKACETCHTDIKNHLNRDKINTEESRLPSCETCHKEHIADQYLILSNRDEQCIDCHADIKDVYKNAEINNVPHRFKKSHPEFKASMTSNFEEDSPVVTRVNIDDKDKLKEHSGLKFSHKDHLSKLGVLEPQGQSAVTTKLECWSCHKQDSNGAYMQPIKFEEHCHRCHKTTFDELSPDNELPHGKADKILSYLQGFYKNSPKGTRIDVVDDQEKSKRQLPGKAISRGALDFDVEKLTLDQYSKQMGKLVFEKGVCSECHEVLKPNDDFASWKIIKPRFSKTWYPEAKFKHKSHQTFECLSCHAVDKSELSEDVNIQGKKNCIECHSSEDSTCLKCHTFHSEPHFTMNGKPLTTKKEEVKAWHNQSLANEAEAFTKNVKTR